jgi:hypothetical protein
LETYYLLSCSVLTIKTNFNKIKFEKTEEKNRGKKQRKLSTNLPANHLCYKPFSN